MLDLFGLITSDALFSPCDACPGPARELCEDPVHCPWRYRLIRRWDEGLPMVCWIMLNPSTAGHERNDPTIRRCIEFSKRWGFGGMMTGNLFALRATDPAELKRNSDPVGSYNDHHLADMSRKCAVTVCAWGSHPMVNGRAAEVLHLLADIGTEVRCLGRTKIGRPKHPLYVPYGDHLPYDETDY